MSGQADIELIEDMLEACRRIQVYINSISFDDFLDDSKTQDAVIRNIEILGEAAKKVSDSLKSRYSDVPWKRMAGARDRLIHACFGVNVDVIWQIASIEVQGLMNQLQDIQTGDVED